MNPIKMTEIRRLPQRPWARPETWLENYPAKPQRPVKIGAHLIGIIKLLRQVEQGGLFSPGFNQAQENLKFALQLSSIHAVRSATIPHEFEIDGWRQGIGVARNCAEKVGCLICTGPAQVKK